MFVSSPWKTPPGFLERAQAALTATKPSILHMKWDTRVGNVRSCGPEELWLDQPPPHRYRFLVDEPLSWTDAKKRKPYCERPIEFGGAQNTFDALRFQRPNLLIHSQMNLGWFHDDPVADLRAAIDAGRAHDEGTTELDGRTVRRIRLDPPASCPEFPPRCSRRPSYVYVDPETFYPVGEEGPGFISGRGAAARAAAVHVKIRYLEFEYLPRTAENLALTDIRAQHPNATVLP